MREILFRGKRIDNSKWVEGYYMFDFWGNKEHTLHLVDKTSCTVDSETVGLYTGLNDMNGKKIFEGDIVTIHSAPIDEGDNPFSVEWDDEGARFFLYGYGLAADFDNFRGEECEVIGNKFDNPELLED